MVIHDQIAIPQITSIKVCHNLSLSSGVLIPMSRIPPSSSPIFLRNFACCHASYLTFAASYQKRNEKQKAKANAVESIPCSNSITVVMLAAMPLWTEGNHHALHNAGQLSFLATIRSIITLINWIITQTAIGTRNFGTICMERVGKADKHFVLFLERMYSPLEFALYSKRQN